MQKGNDEKEHVCCLCNEMNTFYTLKKIPGRCARRFAMRLLVTIVCLSYVYRHKQGRIFARKKYLDHKEFAVPTK